MKKRYLLPLGIATSFLINGCGSSSSTTTTETVTGQFVDTFVSGLKYTCSSGTTGTTNSSGEYTCNVGDTVEFFLGKYKLGSTTASSGLVTPKVLYPSSTDAELNVAQLLQTLDSGATNGIITIPDNYSALDNISIRPDASTFDADITSAIGKNLVSEAAAQTHLNEAEILVRLSSKTFYYVGGENDAQKVHTIVFNKDLTSFTSTEETTPSATTLNGGTLSLPNNESFTLKEVTDDYLLINFLENGKITTVLRLYSDKTKADAYLESQKDIFSKLIVNTTQYTINSNSVITTKEVKTDGSFTEDVTVLSIDKNFDAKGTYSIANNILTWKRDSGATIVVTYLSHTSEYITSSASLDGGEAFKTYWFTTEEARDTKGKELIK